MNNLGLNIVISGILLLLSYTSIWGYTNAGFTESVLTFVIPTMIPVFLLGFWVNRVLNILNNNRKVKK